MIKTIDLEICPKYKIGDKLTYFSGPNNDEPVKVEVLDVSIEGQFYYDPQADKVVVSGMSLWDKTYARYMLKVLESVQTKAGENWLNAGEGLFPEIKTVDKYSKSL